MTGEICEYEKLRLKNIAERQKFFNEFMQQNGQESFDLSKVSKQVKPKRLQKKRAKLLVPEQHVDRQLRVRKVISYKFPDPVERQQLRVRKVKSSEVSQPVPIRRSSRSLESRINYSEISSEDEENCSIDAVGNSDFSPNLDFKPYQPRKNVKIVSTNDPGVTLPEAEVTDNVLANIVNTSKE